MNNQDEWHSTRRRRSSANLIKNFPAAGERDGVLLADDDNEVAAAAETPGAYAVRREDAASESDDSVEHEERAECVTVPVMLVPAQLSDETEQASVVFDPTPILWKPSCCTRKTSLILLAIFIFCSAIVAASVAVVVVIRLQDDTAEEPEISTENDRCVSYPGGVTSPDPFVQCECRHEITQSSVRVRTAYNSLKNSAELRDHLEENIDFRSCDPVNKALIWTAMELSDAILPVERVISRFILVLFYAATGGEEWINQDNWLSGWSECNWYGIECDERRNVISISLPNNGLQGTIETRVGLLPNLRSLVLAENGIHGSIPSSLFSFPALEDLLLGDNKLVGTFPELISNYSVNLQRLSLSSNDLTGAMPNLSELVNLVELRMGDTQMTGGFPLNGLDKLSQLEILDLVFSRDLPRMLLSSLTTSTSLKALVLTGTDWSGTIPESIGNMSKLERLNLNGCWLTGSIPTTMGNLANLVSLELQGTFLEGSIPSALGNNAQLQYFEVSGNLAIMGSIPPELANCKHLTYFGVKRTMVGGRIPSSFEKFENLQTLIIACSSVDSIPLGLCADSTTIEIHTGQLGAANCSCCTETTFACPL